ncbi:DivIVA domain-containing protein [[Mycobacterium] burgundiense]|uniref:Cell wall synthesis protein Wag31 n=1 Tax=[Mycobacterium] burgundiense TaxID=3064286 RepID=A0ABM9M5B3_9MYCO|nr:DivIVA domain-containing protein [Mycolicibacterium sp. MU0053]CAJ1510332.1 DivIVA domain-containing protein [Mycolicibacterium sp. MU0053]
MSALLTAADVRDARFRKPRFGRRGYDEDQVDKLLEEVVARLEGRGTLTAAEVRETRLRKPPVGKRGYNEDEVEELLERIACTLEALRR